MRLYGYTTACERSQRTPHGPRRLQAEYEPLLGIGHLTYLDEGNDEMDAAALKLQSTFSCLEAVMNLPSNGLLMRETGGGRRSELSEESASQCGFSAEFITRSRKQDNVYRHS
jgi:hypothetical protein